MAVPSRATNWGWEEYTIAFPAHTLNRVEVEVFHELGSDFDPRPIMEQRLIPSSKFPTLVTFKSEVLRGAAQRLRSPEYTATVRRRKARALVEEMKALEQYCEREDLTVWTFPILNQIKELLAFLADADEEGNTREILRQVRNTLMNGGWNRYRDAKARITVAAILERLANAEEVHAEDVDSVFDDLCRAKLNPVGSFLSGTENESPDVEKEAEVPD